MKQQFYWIEWWRLPLLAKTFQNSPETSLSLQNFETQRLHYLILIWNYEPETRLWLISLAFVKGKYTSSMTKWEKGREGNISWRLNMMQKMGIYHPSKDILWNINYLHSANNARGTDLLWNHSSQQNKTQFHNKLGPQTMMNTHFH